MLEFRLGNIRITVSFWFLAAIGFFILYERSALFFYFAVPIIVHELGHIIVLYLCGGSISAINLRAFGVDICPNKLRLSYHHEIMVTIAGIACNVIMALLLFWQRGQTMRSMLLISVNMAVAVFNILPIGNLDGGVLLRLLCEKTGNSHNTNTISCAVSFLLLLPLFILAFYLLLQPARNVTLLIVCIYLLVMVIRGG